MKSAVRSHASAKVVTMGSRRRSEVLQSLDAEGARLGRRLNDRGRASAARARRFDARRAVVAAATGKGGMATRRAWSQAAVRTG